MPDFGIMRGFNEKLFGDKLYAGQLPTQLGLIGSNDFGDYLLNLYPNASAAYSLRKLRAEYTSNAIRVRRSSDNTELDIGFLNNELDTSSLTSFCSGTNGFVTTWYDQSGNTRNATQTTAANQPQIVSSGSVVIQGSKPAVQFDGTSHNFSGSLTTSGSYTNYAICYLNTVTFYRGIFNTSQMMLLANILGGTRWGTYGGADQPANSTIQQIHAMVTMISPTGTNGTFYRNGVTDGTYTNSESQGSPFIGGTVNQRFNGKIQEIVFWGVNQSSNISTIQTLNNNFYGIY
jgi:hypothetical protein